MSDEEASWVYAVVPGQAPPPLGELTGVMAEPLRLVREADLAAVVGSVPAEEVVEARLQERLADAAWLERVVRAHHEVVSAYFAAVPTVPFRLATVYHHDARVAQLLREESVGLREALDTVTGRAEWGVRATCVTTEAAGEQGDAGQPEPRSERSGTEYLLRRREQRERRQQARAEAVVAARQVDEALREFALAVHRSPPPARAADGEPESVVLNSAYLVDDDRAEEFTGTVHTVLDELPQLRIRLTGPWPAYSFVTVAGGGG